MLAAQALFYQPLAGGGNPGAVASALYRGPYPAPFTPMDLMYKSLDLLNFGDPAPLRAALIQLDGEIYASAKTVLLTDSIYVREAVLGRLRQSSFMGRTGPIAALGAGGPTLAYANSSEQQFACCGLGPLLMRTNAGARFPSRHCRPRQRRRRCIGSRA